MKKQILKAIGGTALVILVLAAVARVPGQVQTGNSLVGSWDVQVTIRDCQTGTPFFSFPGTITYDQGGTLQQSDVGAPTGIRLQGQGVWSHQTGRQYSSAFRFLNFNFDHTPAGKNVVRSTINLGPGGNEYSATDTFEILDANGNLIARGCATQAATRFE